VSTSTPLAAAAALAATGATGRLKGAALTATAARSATGRMDASGDASLAVTAALSATGARGAPAMLLNLLAGASLGASLAIAGVVPDSAVRGRSAIGFGALLRAQSHVDAPAFVDPTGRLRLTPGILVNLPTPIISNGKPTLPAHVARLGGAVTLIEGPDHIHAIPDPNPVWDPATSGWFTQPPPSGAGDHRWVVDDLPDPAGYPNGWYWLGEPSFSDGTSGIEAAAQQWAPNGSTPGSPSWQSVYPYKPSVRAHVNYGPSGEILTVTKGVRFNLQYIEHMWADYGSFLQPPFTYIVVAIVMDYPYPSYEHTILDTGRAPTDGGAPVLDISGLNYEYGLDENIQGGARPAMMAGLTQQRNFADYNATQQIYTPFNYATRPKMFFGVYDGPNSFAGNFSTSGKYLVSSPLPAGGGSQERFTLLGRRSNVLSREWASHLVVFEIRRWNSALSEHQIHQQYGQLSSTWKFNAYG
jgi:hypothetical protein